MLGKRAVSMQAGGQSVQGRRPGKKSQGIVFDFSPSMISFLKTASILVGLMVLFGIMHGINTKWGYEVVSAQHQVVQLKKDNDTLAVEVATLKSPTRVQKIATEELGLVLPDSFVYSTKGAKADRAAH